MEMVKINLIYIFNYIYIKTGSEYFPDGSKYIGSYFKGLKQGSGKLLIDENKYYIGEFYSDKIQGFGSFIFSDFKYCQGMWENNELNGLNIFFKDDKLHKGKFFKFNFLI